MLGRERKGDRIWRDIQPLPYLWATTRMSTCISTPHILWIYMYIIRPRVLHIHIYSTDTHFGICIQYIWQYYLPTTQTYIVQNCAFTHAEWMYYYNICYMIKGPDEKKKWEDKRLLLYSVRFSFFILVSASFIYLFLVCFFLARRRRPLLTEIGLKSKLYKIFACLRPTGPPNKIEGVWFIC